MAADEVNFDPDRIACLEDMVNRFIYAIYADNPEGLPQPFRDLVYEAEMLLGAYDDLHDKQCACGE